MLRDTLHTELVRTENKSIKHKVLYYFNNTNLHIVIYTIDHKNDLIKHYTQFMVKYTNKLYLKLMMNKKQNKARMRKYLKDLHILTIDDAKRIDEIHVATREPAKGHIILAKL